MTQEELLTKTPTQLASLAAQAMGWRTLNDTMFEDGESIYCSDPLQEGDTCYWNPALVADDAITLAEHVADAYDLIIKADRTAGPAKWWNAEFIDVEVGEYVSVSGNVKDESLARALTIASLLASEASK